MSANRNAIVNAHLQKFPGNTDDIWLSLHQFAWGQAAILDERRQISLPPKIGDLFGIVRNTLIVHPEYVKTAGLISAKCYYQANYDYAMKTGGVLVTGTPGIGALSFLPHIRLVWLTYPRREDNFPPLSPYVHFGSGKTSFLLHWQIPPGVH